ncbi:MAG: hypothetical protein NVV60_00550 [Luteimonas sp.]|nr:hypothetical protein [Luteimonas sp.]
MSNAYQERIARAAAERRQQQAGAITLAQDTTPDKTAEVIDLSRRTGAPVGAVRADPEGARQQVRRDELAAAPPTVAAWATSDPDRYAMVQDDIPLLARFAQLPQPVKLSALTVAGPAIHMSQAIPRNPQEAVDVARAAPAGAVRQVGGVLGGLGQVYNMGARWIDRGLQAVGLDPFALGPASRLPIWLRPGDSFVGSGEAIKAGADAIDVPADRQTIATDIAGATGQLGIQVVQGLLAPQTLTGSLAAQGADVMAGRAEDAGTIGTFEADMAILSGAGVTAVVERLGIGRVLEKLPDSVRNSTVRRIADIAVAGGTEAATEVVEGIAQDLLTRAAIDEDYAVAEGLEREAIAAGGAGAILRGVVHAVASRRARIEARAEQQHIDAMVETAEASKLKQRAPELLADLVEQAQPDVQVFVPLEALRSHYGDRTEAAVSTLTGNPEAFAESELSGAEVAVPLGRYVSIVSQSDHAALRDAMRLTAGEDVKPGSPAFDGEALVRETMAEARRVDADATGATGTVQTNAADPTLPADAMDANSYAFYLAARAAEQEARKTYAQAERQRQMERAAERRAAATWKTTHAEVEAELRQQPVYRAERILRTGRLPDGTFAEVRAKLSHAAVVAGYGDAAAEALKGMTVQRGGLDPDAAAAVLGFDSGARLIHDLTTMTPLDDAARVETDARTAELDTDPDVADDGTDAKARALEAELQGLERRAGGIRTHVAVMKETARRIMSQKEVAKIRPEVYRLAEARAAREAVQAAIKRDWRALHAARRRQLHALLLQREARDARDFATKSGRRFAQVMKTRALQRIGLAGSDYQEQLVGLLSRFNLAPLTGAQMEAKQSLAAWMKAKAEQGVIVDVPPAIADEAFRMPLRKLKLGELRELRDAVETIVHAANDANMLRLEGELVAREEVDQAMAESVLAHHKLRGHDSGDPKLGEKIRDEALSARALTATATDIARDLDGFTDNGAVWTNTVRVIRTANARTNAEIRTAQEAHAALKLKHYTKQELRAFKSRTFIPEVGAAWSKERMLALALNWGNQGNRDAILEQTDRRLSPEQVGAILGRLDGRDWDYVEAVWKTIGRHWDDIAATQRRRTGLAPERVPPSPFVVTLPDGTQRAISGGYFPLKYEARSVKELRIMDAEAYRDLQTGRFSKAATRRGHTLERVGSGGRTVRLDLGVVTQHEREVIRDLRLGDAVNYVHNVLHGKEFTAAVNATDMAPLVNGLDLWLRDVATGEVGVRRLWERGLRMLRTNFTAAVLTMRVDSALLQQTGLLQSATILGKREMVEGVKRAYRHPVREYKRVTEASEFMRARLQTHVEAVQRVMDAEAGTFGAAHAAMIRNGYWMMGKSQATVDLATWIAAEQKALERGDDPATARAFADDVVSRAQASGDWIDKTAIQRGTLSENNRQSELIRATTVLQSYMTAKFNAAYERTATADFRSVSGGMSWAMDMASLFIVEGMLAAIIRGRWPDDEENDGYLDDVIGWAADEGLSAAMGGLPGLSIAASELRGYDAKGLFAELWEAVGRSSTQLSQGEMDAANRRAQINLAGMLFGIPSSQLNRTLDAIEASGDGKDVSPIEYLSGPKKE